MKGIPLTNKEKKEIVPGEAITLAAILSILSISLIAVVVYRIFMSKKGTLKLPGGWAFSWN